MKIKNLILIFFFLISQISFAQTASADSLKEYVASYKMKEGSPFDRGRLGGK